MTVHASLFLDSGAIFTPCKRYRPRLWRIWDESKPLLMMLLLNPSTADATANDPTISRQITRAHKSGYGGLLVGNIFDYRATDPCVMKKADFPSSPDNDAEILLMAAQTVASGGRIICGWGTHGSHRGRGAAVRELLKDYDLYALKVNDDGSPQHPLYLGFNAIPEIYRAAIC